MIDYKHRDPRSMRGDYIPPRHTSNTSPSRLRSALWLLALAAFVVVYGWIGAEDHKEALRAEQHYCEMVRAGHWPAYNDQINCN